MASAIPSRVSADLSNGDYSVLVNQINDIHATLNSINYQYPEEIVTVALRIIEQTIDLIRKADDYQAEKQVTNAITNLRLHHYRYGICDPPEKDTNKHK